MFNKTKCKNCGNKVGKKFEFCPNCGSRIAGSSRAFEEGELGMFGREDIPSQNPFEEMKLPLGFNFLFKSLVKELDKQFKELDKQMVSEQNMERVMKEQNKNKFQKMGGISISISSSGNNSPEIKIKSFGDPGMLGIKDSGFAKLSNLNEQRNKKTPRKVEVQEFSEEKQKQLLNLPRKEPATNIRRLSNKLIYEIDVPDVKSIKDVAVKQLENSIEVKAISKDKAYFKLIPISLPITKYKLKDGKLVLELEAKN